MCTHQKYVHNKYIHKSILVSCGKCESCQQEKANARALRIRNHNDGKLCLFVTLTYENRFIPYIKSSDLLNLSLDNVHDIKIYRDAYLRFYKDKQIVDYNTTVLDTLPSSSFEEFCYNVPELNKKSGCVGVVYWPDVQNFIKRLRINLHRDGKLFKFTYYAVGEYGKTTHRCHFHLLLYFSEGSLEEIRPYLVKAWPFGDMLRKDKRIQIAIDASGYVASYVNKSASLPKILTSLPIRQKHSHSLYFGANLPCFSLASLLRKADNGNMSYSREILKDGVPLLVSLPVPKYVISRYFPKFKGYSSLTPDEVRQCLSNPISLADKFRSTENLITITNIPSLDGKSRHSISFRQVDGRFLGDELRYSYEDFHKFVVHLRHCVDYYIKSTGKNIFDYCLDYERVWNQRFSYIFKHSFDDISSISDFFEFYENANEFVENPLLSPTLPDPSIYFYETNPNKRKFVVRKSSSLSDLYRIKENIKEINSIALSSLDDEF